MKGSEIFKKNPDVVARRIGEEYVLVPVVSRIADMDSLYYLNEVAGFVYNSLDGSTDIKGIAAMVANEFDIDENTACADIIECLEDMSELIEKIKV